MIPVRVVRGRCGWSAIDKSGDLVGMEADALADANRGDLAGGDHALDCAEGQAGLGGHVLIAE